MGNISIVIGSWGSYNECNERALGSKWLDLSDYNDWEEIVEELKREGFELDGIDEELFIQDIEGISDRSVNWDYMNPENLFNTLYESGVLTNGYKYKELCAFLEVKNYDDFEELVKNRGENWDDRQFDSGNGTRHHQSNNKRTTECIKSIIKKRFCHKWQNRFFPSIVKLK